MSTHNIGFYEEISKIITELSSNIIKYTPYFFCCVSNNQFYSVTLNELAMKPEKAYYTVDSEMFARS